MANNDAPEPSAAAELKPCPFCQGPARRRSTAGFVHQEAMCESPSCPGALVWISLPAWNRRAESAEVETVRECLSLMKDFQSGGEDARDLLDLVRDWTAANRAIPDGEHEGADGLEDVVKWLTDERDSLRAEVARLKEERDAAPAWRCFHCDEVFTRKDDARLHFGAGQCHQPGCVEKVQGGEIGLLRRVRELEQQLVPYLEETSAVETYLRSVQGEHAQALRREEERGYDRGISDMHGERDAALQRAEQAEKDRDKYSHWYQDLARAIANDPVIGSESALAVYIREMRFERDSLSSQLTEAKAEVERLAKMHECSTATSREYWQQVEALRLSLAASEAREVKLREALTKSAKQFRVYEQVHLGKNNGAKANANGKMALDIERLLSESAPTAALAGMLEEAWREGFGKELATEAAWRASKACERLERRER